MEDKDDKALTDAMKVGFDTRADVKELREENIRLRAELAKYSRAVESNLARVFNTDIDSLETDIARLKAELADEKERTAVALENHQSLATASDRIIAGLRAELAAAREGGIGRIAAERQRQVQVEGWTAEHDASHSAGEMAIAAALYAAPMKLFAVGPDHRGSDCFYNPWPWDKKWDKRGKHDRIRRLEIAGALIAAEIDRFLYAARKGGAE